MKRDEKKVSWGSIRLSLEPSENDLFMGLKGKWRNLLRKAQKLYVKVIEVTQIDEIISLIDVYDNFQKENNFVGIPKNLLESMFEKSDDGMKIKVYKTLFNNNLSGFVFIAYHGDTATYLVGWTSCDGRNQQANYLLLWDSIITFTYNF